MGVSNLAGPQLLVVNSKANLAQNWILSPLKWGSVYNGPFEPPDTTGKYWLGLNRMEIRVGVFGTCA